MKKTEFKDADHSTPKDLFEEFSQPPGGLAPVQNETPQKTTVDETAGTLDKIFTIVKWVFLYLPGVAAIHIAMMGLAMMFFYREFEPFGLLGLVVVGTFMIMLGLGKMRDLKYLKSVLTVLGFSLLAAILYDILAIFIKGDFFSLYVKLTFPLVAAVGYLSRRSIDAEDKPEK